jgi:hypothetical protein
MKTIFDALLDPTECDFVDLALRPLQATEQRLEPLRQKARRDSLAEAKKIDTLSQAFFDESIAELLEANRPQRRRR